MSIDQEWSELQRQKNTPPSMFEECSMRDAEGAEIAIKTLAKGVDVITLHEFPGGIKATVTFRRVGIKDFYGRQVFCQCST